MNFLKRLTTWLCPDEKFVGSRIVGLFEVYFGFVLFGIVWNRGVDWSSFWLGIVPPAPSPMPWGRWMAIDLASLALFYHGACAMAQKRWAVILSGVIGFAGWIAIILLVANRISLGAKLGSSLGEFLSDWGLYIALLSVFKWAMVEGRTAWKTRHGAEATAPSVASTQETMAEIENSTAVQVQA